MRTAYAALAAALLLAVVVSASATVECGDLGTVEYLSGCIACTAMNVTGGGRNKSRSSGAQASPPPHKDHGHSWGMSGSKLVPVCTECDTSKFFELKTWPADPSSSGRARSGRCGCIAGYGAKPAGEVTVTTSKKTKTKQLFECVKCSADQVTLGHGSGVIPVQDQATGMWSLALGSFKGKKDGAPAPGTPNAPKPGSKGGRKGGPGGGKGKGSFGPYLAGQCINCPANSKKQGTACVAA